MRQLKEIPLSQIGGDPDQPRKVFDEEKLNDLAESIKAIGVVQAISVREINHNQYMIVAGERRWRASKIAGKETIPAIILTKEEAENKSIITTTQLTENILRENLNPIEKCEFVNTMLAELIEMEIESPRKVLAAQIGVTESWVSKALAPLKYSEDLRQVVMAGKIKDYSIVKKIEKLKPKKREEALQLIKIGEFNSKEFFKRKRYEPKAKVDNSEQQNNDSEINNKNQSKNLLIKDNDLIDIIEKTEYKYVLEMTDKDWKNNNKIDKILEKFIEWCKNEKGSY